MILRAAGLLCLLTGGPGDDPVSVWTFDAAHLRGDAFKASAGPLEAKASGPVRFAAEAPRALLLGEASEPGAPKAQAARKGGGLLTIATDIPGPALPVRETTVEAWVRIDQPQEWGGIVGLLEDNGDFERGWLLGYNQNVFTFALSSNGRKRLTYLAGKRSYQPGSWYHVAGTYDGSEMRLYVDGAPAASDKSQSGDIFYPPKGFYTIGAYRDSNESYPMAGQIEQISVWKRALAADEIRKRFDERKSRFPGIVAERPAVVDWPTHLRDNQRTAMTDAAPAFPLGLRWVHKLRHPPAPAWPPEAKQDFFNNKPVLPERTTYDHAFHLAAVGDLVCFGSSADDQLRALDLETGRLRWTFFAEGPVRLAPAFAEGRVLFGSDDGVVYCLDAKDGLLQWKLRAGAALRLPGNQRVMSAMPVRTGVLVEGQEVHYCAGLFAGEGVVHGSADLKSGRKLGEAAFESSPQGYMEQRSGRLFVSTGRASAGAFVAQLERRAKSAGREIGALGAEYPFAFIGAGPARFGGGDGKVAAFSAEDGAKLWSADVEGRAHSLAFVRGRLLVSTDRGWIYCFGPGESKSEEIAPAAPVELPPAVLPDGAPSKGYALLLGGDPALAAELARRTSLTIVVAEGDPARADRARRVLDAAGLYGIRVAVHVIRPDGELPYADGMFNLVVGEGRRSEVQRVTRPAKPPAGAGSWTHLYADPANTACSGDRLVGSELRLQWFGLPGPRNMIDRHHRSGPPLSRDGRVFVPGNDRVFALDAWNGTPLWELEIPDSRRMAIFRDCGNMALAEDALYVAAGGACLRIEPQAGTVLGKWAAPAEGRDWGYLAVVGDLALASTVPPGASQRELSRRMTTSETYWDFKPLVCSDALFALDRKDGAPRWTYRPKGAVVNPTITVGGGKVFFVESADEGTLAKGRAPLSELVGKGCRVVALDLRSGAALWSQPHDLSTVQHALYGTFAQEKFVLTGSRNSGTGKGATVWYDVRALEAATGREAWFKTQNYGAGINGEHGEQDHHPVAVGDRLYVEPCVIDLKTGKELENWGWKPRRGCGTFSASASTLFFRDQTACLLDFATKQKKSLTTATRPGCWINMIPAGGVLVIPEASSGCSCDFAVQTSLGFVPRKGR